jgi:hypothetical protein
MDDKITIIEGPPPTFETANEGWSFGLVESPGLYDIALTRMRTNNGPALVERCHRTWSHRDTMQLEYRGIDGLLNLAPILAARSLEVAEGQLLLLWVRLESQQSAESVGFEDDSGEEFDDDPGFPGP